MRIELDITKAPFIWYGPHECARCHKQIIKAAVEHGGVELDYPTDGIRYPNTPWAEHDCGSYQLIG